MMGHGIGWVGSRGGAAASMWLLVGCGLCAPCLAADGGGQPAGLPRSERFAVEIGGESVPVYAVKVPPRGPIPRLEGSRGRHGMASFARFDVAGPTEVTVRCPEEVRSVKVLPESLGIVPKFHGQTVWVTLERPAHVTVEVNGDWHDSLHLFADRPETPPEGSKVLRFGPGVHEITHLVIGDDTVVYLEEGAVLQCRPAEDEPNVDFGLGPMPPPSIEVVGRNVTIRGRGVIDQSRVPGKIRRFTLVVRDSSNVKIEGVTFVDPSRWTMPIFRSENVEIRNVRIFGWRGNSDGIDICNSRDVVVDSCFMRTYDDLVVVKAFAGHGRVERVRVRRCVLWNEMAHALSIGAEIREDVRGVLFEDCDVIHDVGRETALRIYHCDDALIEDVMFQDIRVEEARRLIACWIGRTRWSESEERGRIRQVIFRDIVARSAPIDPTLKGFQDGPDWKPYEIGDHARVELLGFDAQHRVEDVCFDNVVIDGRSLRAESVVTNAFVDDVRFR